MVIRCGGQRIQPTIANRTFLRTPPGLYSVRTAAAEVSTSCRRWAADYEKSLSVAGTPLIPRTGNGLRTGVVNDILESLGQFGSFRPPAESRRRLLRRTARVRIRSGHPI